MENLVGCDFNQEWWKCLLLNVTREWRIGRLSHSSLILWIKILSCLVINLQKGNDTFLHVILTKNKIIIISLIFLLQFLTFILLKHDTDDDTEQMPTYFAVLMPLNYMVGVYKSDLIKNLFIHSNQRQCKHSLLLRI